MDAVRAVGVVESDGVSGRGGVRKWACNYAIFPDWQDADGEEGCVCDSGTGRAGSEEGRAETYARVEDGGVRVRRVGKRYMLESEIAGNVVMFHSGQSYSVPWMSFILGFRGTMNRSYTSQNVDSFKLSIKIITTVLRHFARLKGPFWFINGLDDFANVKR